MQEIQQQAKDGFKDWQDKAAEHDATPDPAPRNRHERRAAASQARKAKRPAKV